MFYCTYILCSERDGKLYTGLTDDLLHRFKMHQAGRVDATRTRRPLLLVYYEACRSKEKAILREKYFKTGFGRAFLHKRIE